MPTIPHDNNTDHHSAEQTSRERSPATSPWRSELPESHKAAGGAVQNTSPIPTGCPHALAGWEVTAIRVLHAAPPSVRDLARR